MIESGHDIYAKLAYPMLAIGLIGATGAIIGFILDKKALVVCGQAMVGAHLLMYLLLFNSWLLGSAGLSIVAGGCAYPSFKKKGRPFLWWFLLSAPIGVIYILTMGLWALYVLAHGP